MTQDASVPRDDAGLAVPPPPPPPGSPDWVEALPDRRDDQTAAGPARVPMPSALAGTVGQAALVWMWLVIGPALTGAGAGLLWPDYNEYGETEFSWDSFWGGALVGFAIAVPTLVMFTVLQRVLVELRRR